MFAETVDIEIDDSGHYSASFRTDFPEEEGSLLVLVERLAADGSFEASLSIKRRLPDVTTDEGMTAQAASDEASAHELELEGDVRAELRLFAGRLSAQAETIRLSISAAPRSRFRVFVGWVKGAAGWVSCKVCKAVITAALKAVAAKLGLIVHDIINLPLALLEEADLLDLTPILEFLKDVLGSEAWEFIRGIWSALGLVNRAIKAVAAEICQRLGFCN